MEPLGPTLRRKRRREHPAWRALLALAVSVLVNWLVVTRLDASWLGVHAAAVRRDVAIAPLSAADWEANRAVRPPGAAPVPAPEAPPAETPRPPGQVVKVDDGDAEARPPKDSRFVSDQDRTVAKETKARLVPSREDQPQVPTRPTVAQEPGKGGQEDWTSPGAPGPKGKAAEPVKVARADPERLAPGEQGERPAPAAAPEQAAGGGGAAQRGAPDLRLALAPSTVAKVLGRSVGDALEDVDEGEGTFLNTRSWKYATYFNRIKESVGNAWRPAREIERRDPDGSVYFFKDRLTVLSVTLDDKGGLKDVKVVRSSSIDFLDRVAVEAFEKAQPFSNPPAGLVNAQGEIKYVLGFEVYGARPGLHLYRGPAPF